MADVRLSHLPIEVLVTDTVTSDVRLSHLPIEVLVSIGVPAPPEVITVAATAITSTSAILNGTIDPNGTFAYGFFRWGTGSPSPDADTTPELIGSGYSAVAFEWVLTGLTTNTTYYFQAIASVDGSPSEIEGAIFSFTTGDEQPVVVTVAATSVTRTSAILRGTIDPNGFTMTGFFRWGVGSPPTDAETAPSSAIGSGSVPVAYAFVLTGLTPDTTYYFRAVGNDGSSPGDIDGAILSFTTTVEQAFIDGEVSNPLAWLALTDRADVLHNFAEVDLNDPASYYGGYKAPWVVRFLPIARGLSDRMGQIEHLSFGALLSDTGAHADGPDRFFRTLLASESSPPTKYLTNRPLAEWFVDDEARRVQDLPRLAAVGYVSDYSPKPGLRFETKGVDWLKKKFSRKRKAQQSWQPVILEEDFSSIPGKGVPDETILIAAPIIYGDLSEKITGTALVTPTNLAAVVVGAAGSYTYTYGVTALTPGVRSRDEHWGETDAAYVTVTNAPALNEMSAARYVELTWDAQTYAGSYRIYGRLSGGTLNLNYLEENDDTTYEDGLDGDVADEESDSRPPPVNNSLVASEGRGAAPVIWVGRRLVPGVPTTNKERHEFLVACHACKAITGVYVDGVRLTDAQIAASLLVPGTAEYIAAIGSATYRDFNGRRYTLIYCKEDSLGDRLRSGESVLTLDVEGIEDVGDGTGELIRSIVYQRLHFMNNWIAPDTPYQSGAYLTAADTVFPHLPTLTLVDEASHDAVQAESELRIPGGYEGAGIIGAGGEFVSATDALARFHVSGDFEQVFNRKGQDSVSMEPSVPSTGLPAITDVMSIAEGSFQITDQVQSAFFNLLPYVTSPNYTNRVLMGPPANAGWLHKGEERSQTSIEFYDQERESARYELHFGWAFTLQGLATINDGMARKRARFRDPRRQAIVTVPFSGLAYEPGETAKITHLEGVGASGWVGRTVRFTRHEVEPTEGRVRLECYDLDAVLDAE